MRASANRSMNRRAGSDSGSVRGGTYDPARRAAPLERFDLDPSKKIKAYSKGNRQKVALVAALTTEAELYIFDEPTSGLDPLMEAVFRDYVSEIRTRGATVLLSSHILAEVEALCDRISIIRRGRIVESGTLAELRHLSRTEVVAVTVTGAGSQPAQWRAQRLDRRRHAALRRRRPGDERLPGLARPDRRHLADRPPADARGTLPSALRRPGAR